MKNAFKKLAAFAMAFTLLGTGTALTKAIAPQTDNTIVAYADTLILSPTGEINKYGAVFKVELYPGIYSRKYTNVNSNRMRYYRQRSKVTLKNNFKLSRKHSYVCAEDNSYVWGQTMYGEYIPILYKSVNRRIYG